MASKSGIQGRATKTRKARFRQARLDALPAWQPPDVITYTGQLRPRVYGEERSVHGFAAGELEDMVAGVYRGQDVIVSSRGMLSSAGDLMGEVATITNPEAFIRSGVAKMITRALEKDEAKGYRLLLGDDNPGSYASPKRLLSAEERATRVAEAVVTAAGALHRAGHDAATMFDDDFIAATMAFVRKHVTWNGKENGSIFELVDTYDFRVIQWLSGQKPWLGIDLPMPSAGHGRRLGYDGGVPAPDGSVVPLQQKAYALSGVTARGELTHRRTGTDRNYNHLDCANEIVYQSFGDGVRVRRWRHMVPEPDVKQPPASIPWDPNRAKWRRVQPVTIVRLSTDHLVEDTYLRVFEGPHVPGIFSPIRTADLPGDIRPEVRRIFGDTIPNGMPFDDFGAHMRGWLDRTVDEHQEFVNTMLAKADNRKEMIYEGADPQGFWTIDTYPEIRLVASHQRDRFREVAEDLGLIAPNGPWPW